MSTLTPEIRALLTAAMDAPTLSDFSLYVVRALQAAVAYIEELEGIIKTYEAEAEILS